MTHIVREALDEYLNNPEIVLIKLQEKTIIKKEAKMSKRTEDCMKCPHCKKEITTVYVYSNCHQKAWINNEGKILEYAKVELEETTDIGCSQCLKSLKEVIHG